MKKIDICLDIGGMSTKLYIFDGDEIIQDYIFTYKNLIEAIILIKDLSAKLEEISKNYIISNISISTCGAVDSDKGIIVGISAIYNYEGTDFKKIFKKYSPNIYVDNDAVCSLLGEKYYSEQLKAYKNIVSIVVGTGIGGSIMIDGKIVKGKQLFAGEYGCILHENKNDIYSVTTSARSVAMTYNKLTGKNLDTKGIFEIYDNDLIAHKIINDCCENMALMILNINSILNPDVFIIGGAISANNLYINLIKKHTKNLIKAIPINVDIKILSAKLNNLANIYGAKYLINNSI